MLDSTNGSYRQKRAVNHFISFKKTQLARTSWCKCSNIYLKIQNGFGD